MRKSFKYSATINKDCAANCFNIINLCRYLYNSALCQRIVVYNSTKKGLNFYNQCLELPALKKEFPEFKAVPSQTLQDVLNRLNKSFMGFFNRVKMGTDKAGFPRYRCKDQYHSFVLKQAGWKLEHSYLYVKNVGRFKLKLHRPIEGNIKTVTITQTPTGKWFVIFSCDNVPEKIYPEPTIFGVGIDVNLENFLTDSENGVVDNPRHFRNGEQYLRLCQRRLSRRKKSSNNRRDARLLVAKAHEHVCNQRQDFLHKIADTYVSTYGNIYVENLKIKNMIKNRHLSKSIADVAWGKFFEFVFYKAENAGRTLLKVSPHNTTQLCSRCGKIVPKTLKERVHDCKNCGLVLSRDHNSAINILKRGLGIEPLDANVEFQTSSVV